MKTFTLSIPSACSQKWESLTHTAQGGFCTACSKTVIDFTGKTQEEIIRYFQNPPSHTCGRFRPAQLRTYTFSDLSQVRPGYTLLKMGVAALLMALLAKPAAAQDQLNKSKTERVYEKTRTQMDTTMARDVVINGVVRSSEDALTLPGASILVKDTQRGTEADMNGEFTLGELHPGDVLEVSFVGYETREYTVPKVSTGPITIELSADLMGMVGEVTVTDVFRHESPFRKAWDGLKRIF